MIRFAHSMVIASLLTFSLLAQSPSLLDTFNLTQGERRLVQRNGKWRLEGTHCDKKTVTRVIVDDANGYLHFTGRDDSACDEPSEHQFVALTLADHSTVWLEAATNVFGCDLQAYVMRDDKMTAAPPEILASLPTVDALLPKGVRNPAFEPKLAFVLPQRGTTVTVKLQDGHADRFCAGLDEKTPKPAECAADSTAPLRAGLQVKWNVKQSRFDPPAP